MARTWSNNKRIPDELSAAQREKRGRPSSVSPFIIAVTLVVIFFLGLTFTWAYDSLRHPITSIPQSANVSKAQ